MFDSGMLWIQRGSADCVHEFESVTSSTSPYLTSFLSPQKHKNQMLTKKKK